MSLESRIRILIVSTLLLLLPINSEAQTASIPDWAIDENGQMLFGLSERDFAPPGGVEADVFHPERDQPHRPAMGGTMSIGYYSAPNSLNGILDQKAGGTYIRSVVHASLLKFNKETWQYDLELARNMLVEDTLYLNKPQTAPVIGTVEETRIGYIVTNAIGKKIVLKESDVASWEPKSVYTFEMHEQVPWHDGHILDADDIHFTIEMIRHPKIPSVLESLYRDIEVVVLDATTVQFRLPRFNYLGLSLFSHRLCIVPRHIYDLADPNNSAFDANASAQQQADHFIKHPANHLFIGLGPYRVTSWDTGMVGIRMERFLDYFAGWDSARGYVDSYLWRKPQSTDQGFNLILNDELDIVHFIPDSTYHSQSTRDPNFTDENYKAAQFSAATPYIAWNTQSRHLQDPRVRRALAKAIDLKSWIENSMYGQGIPKVAAAPYFSPGYPQDLSPIEKSLEDAVDLLLEAGYYDRDGNGIVDEPSRGDLSLTLIYPSSSTVGQKFLEAVQEDLRKIGVEVHIRSYDFGTLIEKLRDRDYDGAALAQVFSTLEEGLRGSWHSSVATDKHSDNFSGLRDHKVDKLIQYIEQEADDETRHRLTRQLHERIYELQPMLFMPSGPIKYAIKKRVRGLKLYRFRPGYEPLDLYFVEGTPGTRPLPK